MLTYTLYTTTVHICAHTTKRKAHVNKQFCSHWSRGWGWLCLSCGYHVTEYPPCKWNSTCMLQQWTRLSEPGHLHKTYNKTSLRAFVQDLFFVNHNVLEWEYTPNTEEWFKIHQMFKRREPRPVALCPSSGSEERWQTVPDLPCHMTNGWETGQQRLIRSMLVGSKSLVPAWHFHTLYEHLFEPQFLIFKWH